jgi:hypothetical protein
MEVTVGHPLSHDVYDFLVLVSWRGHNALAYPDKVDDVGVPHLPNVGRSSATAASTDCNTDSSVGGEGRCT